MEVLVLGGTRFFGVHLVNALLQEGHRVTVATRGRHGDPFGERVSRLTLERSDPASLAAALAGRHFDAICDNLAYCSEDLRALPQPPCGDRYVMTSSTAVYQKHIDTPEADFDPAAGELVWCRRADADYAEGKRQAERALFLGALHPNAAAARFPFVLGPEDYTRRLHFYVEHLLAGAPMQIDNLDAPMAFVRADEAGRFLAFLAESPATGPINGASPGAASLRQILDYLADRTGRQPVLADDGDPAPYNGEAPYSIRVERANSLGFSFSPLEAWLWPLLDDLLVSCAARPD